MSDNKGKIVWSNEGGDLRKQKDGRVDLPVNEKLLELKLRRLTAGKGRVVIEVTGLPQNKTWNQDLASQLKKQLGVGGSFKEQMIEVHTDKIESVTKILEKKSIKWKKIGG